MSDKIRTTVFGGTFNPIHNGHLAIARSIIEEGLTDELWFMVTPQNPWKANLSLMDDNIRLQMAKTATEGMSRIYVSDFEFSLPKPSYTADTLRSLDTAYPDREFSLAIGADNWEKFDKWYDNGSIIEKYRIIVYPRNGYNMKPTSSPNVTFLQCPLLDISSTEIRERIRNGLPVSGMVPDKLIPMLGFYQTNGVS